jgi:hypothetical protein
MLKLGLDLSVGNNGGWTPNAESSLVAWFENKTVIGLSSGSVILWGSEGTGPTHAMSQTTFAEAPRYNAATGALTFNPSATQHMSGSQISLTGDFTIGVRLNLIGGVILGDNTEAGEFFKMFSTTKLRVKIDNATAVDLELDSGVWGDGYMVVTRDSNVLTLWWNGVAQTTATPTLSGTADIDSLGIRKLDTNPFEGSISEVQIFSSTSAALTAQINQRLASIV